MLVVESKLFVGMMTGEINMYDAFTLEKLDKTTTHRGAMPMSMAKQSTGTLIMGMSNGTIEVFSF